MADKKEFTAADYAAQRAALDEQIRVAEDDHHRAGYQQVLGEATQDDVDKALVTLDALKSKRRTLEAAWQEAQRRVAAANDALAKADQEKSIGEFKQLLPPASRLPPRWRKPPRCWARWSPNTMMPGHG